MSSALKTLVEGRALLHTKQSVDGAGRRPIAPRAATAAAAATAILQSDGRLIGVREFAALMGGASLRDAHRAHRAWREGILSHARAPVPVASAAPVACGPADDLSKHVASLEAQLQMETARFEGLRRHLLLETARQRDENAQGLRTLAQERDRLEEELVMLRARLRAGRT